MAIEKLTGKMPRALLHQDAGEDGVPEPTILITRFDDLIELSQEQRTVLINMGSVPELIKVLREAAKGGESDG